MTDAELHTATLMSIEQQTVRIETDKVTEYWCGCHLIRDKRWRLCRYHDGFEDGLDLADSERIPAPENQRPRNVFLDHILDETE